MSCAVTQVTADGFYADAGSERGLQGGDTAVVLRDGREVARAEVMAVAGASARFRLLSGAVEEGDRVRVRVRAAPVPEAVPAPKPEKPAAPEAFVPLLERQNKRLAGEGRANLFHGRLSLAQLFHADNEGDLDYWTTILYADGSLDRIGGGPWALRWSGNLSARGGEAFEGSTLEGARLDLYELSLGRRLEKGGFLKLGRFLPNALPAAGYFDGVHAESAPGRGLRFGGILGLKPTRDELDVSADEPTAVLYTTLEAGERARSHYSGTLGVLGSLWEGDPDRAALLIDQSYEAGTRFYLNSSLEVDFDVGGAEFRTGTRLTRGDAQATFRVGRSLSLRAGFDHWEQLDTRAERDALGVADPALFDSGFWRYWGGFGQELPGKLRLDAEVASIHPEPEDPLWRVTLTRRDPFGANGGYASLTAYNLEGASGDGIGGLFGAYVPLGRGRWSVFGSAGFRSIDDSGTSFDVTDVDLRLEYRPTPRWDLHVGAQHSFGEGLDSTLLEVGLGYRW